MRRARVWATGICLTLAGALRATSADAACTKDVDCESELICEAGQCVEPPAAPAPVAAPAPAPIPAPTPAVVPPPAALEPPPIRDDVALPEQAAPAYKRKSRGMMVTGIVLTSLGTLTLGIAIVNNERSSCESSSGLTSCTTRPNYEAWAATGLLLGVGIPLLVIGGKKVPNQPAPQAALAPWLSPHSAGLALRLAL